MTRVRIVIFAKAPVAGFAKTRLIPELGAEGAATLAQQLLKHAVKEAQLARIGPVELCVTPDPQHPFWQTLRQTLELPDSISLSEQGEGDLGQRLARVAQRVIDQGEAVLLTGTDCPQLDSRRLQAAALALASHDSCLIPAHDGGYTLLGLRHYHPSLFIRIPWSTAEVAKLTRERIYTLGWSLAEYTALHDIDESADLVWLPDSWPISGRDTRL